MTKKRLPVVLELEEAQNLLKQPNKRYPTGLRNKAMLSLMLHCGSKVMGSFFLVIFVIILHIMLIICTI